MAPLNLNASGDRRILSTARHFEARMIPLRASMRMSEPPC